MKQDFLNGIFCLFLIVVFILIIFIGIKAVSEGQRNNETIKQYLYQER